MRRDPSPNWCAPYHTCSVANVGFEPDVILECTGVGQVIAESMLADMKQVTNYSRDYTITKLDIRVKYDTNLNKAKKIIKKINAELNQDPEIAQSLLDDIKSQGVRSLDDSAMILRVKYKTTPGKQFVIRRQVYQRIQEEFRANGSESVSSKRHP